MLFVWPALACSPSFLQTCLLEEAYSLANGLHSLLSCVFESVFCMCVCLFAVPYLFLLLHSTLKCCP